jgi:ABC-2 type transport system ATP-binding protein
VLDEPFSGLDPLVRDEFMGGLLRHTREMTVLISSHELVEIEHVTTHLAFLDKGRVLFEEPMDDLKARLRRVRLILDGRPQIKELPREWMDVRIEGNIVTFVETRFSEQQPASRIAAVIGQPCKIETEPIALRSIFTTLARAIREQEN